MPVDRETGRPRGFAFVEFADRAVAEQVIRKFDAQPFQGRNLAVSEARAREDRPLVLPARADSARDLVVQAVAALVGRDPATTGWLWRTTSWRRRIRRSSSRRAARCADGARRA
jgi:RNA recognition motif-containing protein